MSRPRPVAPGPGQESAWEYPRPPRLERTERRVRVVFSGVTVVDSSRAWRVLETSHPPVYYVPPEDARMDLLTPAGKGSFCEWKGEAAYWDLQAGGGQATRCAWSYPNPTAEFEPIRDHLAFYAQPMEACLVDDEKARPQPGGFYGGWITDDVVGPFKGEPGSWGW